MKPAERVPKALDTFTRVGLGAAGVLARPDPRDPGVGSGSWQYQLVSDFFNQF